MPFRNGPGKSGAACRLICRLRSSNPIVGTEHEGFRLTIFRRCGVHGAVCALLLILLSSSTVGRAEVSSTAGLPLFEDLTGKVVLLDFWASWCEPCRHSFPWMAELQRRYADEGLIVVAVNLDQDRRLAEHFLAATPAAFRIEYDPAGTIATQFGVSAMPMSFLIDRTGRVRARHVGFREAQRPEREASLLKLLEE